MLVEVEATSLVLVFAPPAKSVSSAVFMSCDWGTTTTLSRALYSPSWIKGAAPARHCYCVGSWNVASASPIRRGGAGDKRLKIQ